VHRASRALTDVAENAAIVNALAHGHGGLRDRLLGVRHRLEYARLIDELDAAAPT